MKHTFPCWLKTKIGCPQRISGLFCQARFNIETWRLGLPKARSVPADSWWWEGDQSTCKQMTKQLNKLVNRWLNVSTSPRFLRWSGN